MRKKIEVITCDCCGEAIEEPVYTVGQMQADPESGHYLPVGDEKYPDFCAECANHFHELLWAALAKLKTDDNGEKGKGESVTEAPEKEPVTETAPEKEPETVKEPEPEAAPEAEAEKADGDPAPEPGAALEAEPETEKTKKGKAKKETRPVTGLTDAQLTDVSIPVDDRIIACIKRGMPQAEIAKTLHVGTARIASVRSRYDLLRAAAYKN